MVEKRLRTTAVVASWNELLCLIQSNLQLFGMRIVRTY